MTVKRFFVAVSLCLWLTLLVLVVQPSVAQETEPTPVPKEQSLHPRDMLGDPHAGRNNGSRQTPDGLWYMPEGAESKFDASGIAPQDTGGPDDFGYVWDDTEPFNWIDATSGFNTGLSGDDQYTDSIDIGFSFKFYENSYSRFYVSTNGLITFGAGAYQYSNQDIPNPAPPNNYVTPFWDDLSVSCCGNNTGSVYYKRGGIAPNRYLVVEWHEISRLGGLGRLTFEAVLHENGDIVFQYKSLTGYLTNATVGIEDDVGVDGLLYLYNATGLDDGKSIRFYRPGPEGRIKIWPLYHGRFTSSGNVASFQLPIRNIGELGADTYDMDPSSSWMASLYHATDMSPLTDTNGNGAIDTGPIYQGQTKYILVKVQTPVGADVGANNEVALTVRSSLNTAKQRRVSLRTAIPTNFAQVYRDDADGAMSIDYVGPDTHFRRKATDDRYWGYDLAVTELPNLNFLYAWSKGRRISDDPYIYVREIEYAILGPTGELVRQVTRLTDHSSATMSTYDYTPAVTVAPNGRVGILWYRYLWNEHTDQFNYNIHLAALNPDGSLLNGPTALTHNDRWGSWNDLYVPRFNSPEIAATEDDRFVLSWIKNHYGDPNDDCSSNCSVSDIWYAVMSSNGFVRKSATRLTQDTPGWQDAYYNPSLTTASDKKVLLVFQRGGNYGDNYFVVIDRNGDVTQGMTALTTDGNHVWDWAPDAVRLSDGRYVVAWPAKGSGNYIMSFAVLDAGFNRIADRTPIINAPAFTGDGNVSVTADASGRAVLTWMDYDYSNRRNLYYALVDGTGAVLTPPTIFRTSQGYSPYIETSYQGYGNTSYSWWSPRLDIPLYLPLLTH